VTINLDVATYATNVAALWSPSNLTAPSGLDNITISTHLLPNAVTTTPTMLIKPPTGTFEYGPGQLGGELIFPGEFYLSEGSDIPANAQKLYAWYGVLFAKPEGDYDIGGAVGVIDATITGAVMGTLQYAGRDYVGIRFDVRLRISLGYSATT
jgi:hypothetical protein